LLRTSNPASDETLTFFLVSELRDGAGGVILGLSAGPPGAAGLHGTSKSGVVVTAADLATAPADVGKIMAHEGGHFLGLFHTTERSGDQHDSLDDTPECPSANDADSNGRLSVTECADLDGDNVMFWTLTDGAAALTADQSWVLRRNPVVQ
ncbi:MAG: M43 family zinc metalloprotease, partial [Myxococcota bacterium]